VELTERGRFFIIYWSNLDRQWCVSAELPTYGHALSTHGGIVHLPWVREALVTQVIEEESHGQSTQ